MVAMSLLVGLLSAAIAVFALQNNEPMSVRFLGWSLDNVPLAVAILVPFAVGLLTTAIPLGYGRWRWRARARTLQAKVEMLESTLSARDARVATAAPRPGPASAPSGPASAPPARMA
jgi:uncharacterized integral membrane protein